MITLKLDGPEELAEALYYAGVGAVPWEELPPELQQPWIRIASRLLALYQAEP